MAYGSKEWRATKRQERDEEDAAAAAALLDETTDTPRIPLTGPPTADDPKINGAQRSRAKNGKKSVRLPGARVENDGGHLRGDGGQTESGTGSRAISLMGGKLSKLNLGFTKKNASKGKPLRGEL